MKSKSQTNREVKYMEQMMEMLEQLTENRIEIQAVKKDTERIIERLDGINGRVGHSERDLSFMKGFNTVLFTAMGIVIAIIGIFK